MLNYYHSISKPNVIKNISMDELFSTIKNGSNWSEIISQARILDRYHDRKMYEGMKHMVPAITYNFLFNGYRSNENIIKSTGFIYYDLDFPKYQV